jgi:hypothetical protein
VSQEKKRRRTFYFDKTVEVEIDIDDLEEAGYHHEDECPVKSAPAPGAPDLSDALASLHRQAHPNAHGEIFLCLEEPCRSLDLDQIGFGRRTSPRPATVAQVSVEGGVL